MPSMPTEAEAEATGSARDTWRPGPLAVARLGGLPLRFIKAFTSQSAWNAAIAQAQIDAAAKVECALLAEDLYTIVGVIAEGRLKSHLVALRRSVYRGRLPASSEWNEEIESVLTKELAQRVREWHRQLLLRRQFSSDVLRSLIDEDRIAETARILTAASEPEFRHALAQAGPSLEAELDKLLVGKGSPGGIVKSRTLLGLTRYLSRATTKTSPYSTFTTTAAVQWRLPSEPREVPGGRANGSDVTCVLELDRMAVDQIVRAIVANGSVAQHLPVRVNPSLVESDDSSLIVLGRRPTENIVRLLGSDTVRELIASAARAETMADFCKDVARRTGRPTEADQACDRLIELGVVEIVPPVYDQSESPVLDLLGFLRQLPASDVPIGLVDALERLYDALGHRVPIGDSATLRAQRSAVVKALITIANVLSLPWPGPEVLRKVGVHENALRREPFVLDPSPWGEVLDDLRLARSWLAIHDRMIPTRLAVSEYVRCRLGGRIGFVELHDRIQHDLAKPERDDPAWFAGLRPFLQTSAPASASDFEDSNVPLMQRLRHARQLSSALAARTEITRDDVTRLVEAFPPWVKTDDPATAYVQPVAGIDGGLTVVLNTVSGAFGKGVGRWRRLLRQANAEWLPAAGITQDGPIAELSGTFAASVNLRDPAAVCEVNYPFTNSARPADERVALADLVVQWRGEGRLRVTTRSGQQLRVAHLGMMADPLLPPAARLLVALFGQSYLLHPSLGLFHPPVAPDEVQRLPRLTVGRVIIRRAETSFPASQVPRRAAGDTEASFLMRLAGWVEAEALPHRFFLRVVPQDSDWVKRVFAKSRKPLFIDLGSPALRAVFEHSLRDVSGRVVLEEALPDPMDPVLLSFDEPRVTELVLEVNGNAGRT